MTSKNLFTIEKVVQSLSKIWTNFTQEQQSLLLKHIDVKKFKKNEIIYKYLEIPKQAMCLLQGKVKVYKDGIGGRNQIIRVIKPNEFFAYRAYFANESYKTVAMALEECTVALIPIGILIKLMEQNFHISLYFIRQLCFEIGRSDDRTVNLTQKHIRGRLAEALIFLLESYGLEEDGYTLSIYLSREDLANLSNMTTNNAIRTLSAFANEKIIAIDGRKIKIIQEEELRKISNFG